MTATIQLGLAIYLGGCMPAFVFFLTGRAPSLLERNWHWLVIFLWPLLPLWPLRSVFQLLWDWRRRQQNPRGLVPAVRTNREMRRVDKISRHVTVNGC